MIIIEGPEGSGKSTLARTMSGLFCRQIFHTGGSPKSIEEIRERFRHELDDCRGMILDRAMVVSELIYGPILHDRILLTEEEWAEWADRFVRHGWILIYCRPHIDRLRANASDAFRAAANKEYKPNQHAELVYKNIDRIVSEYDRVIRELERRRMVVLRYVWD